MTDILHDYPMSKAHAAPRCSARSKRTGLPCKGPAMKGWKVCRSHGARGGAPRNSAHGNYKHGRFTCEAIEARRETAALIAALKQMAG